MELSNKYKNCIWKCWTTFWCLQIIYVSQNEKIKKKLKIAQRKTKLSIFEYKQIIDIL